MAKTEAYMKKFITLFLSAVMFFSLSGCGNDSASSTGKSTKNLTNLPESTKNPTSQHESTQPAGDNGDESGTESQKILIVYFSKTGNTQTVAGMIAEETGGTLFKVETVTPYPEDYDETVDIARDEQDNNARPELSTHVENMEDYDIIFLGYPNWWGTMPQAMFTFLEEYDFNGKTIIPFCTHGGSALGRSEGDIADLCPDSILLDGLAIRGSSADDAGSKVKEWVEALNIAE